MLCLTEQGIYFFLGRSDKPKALPYQKWVAGEVIPALRKTGHYELPGSKSRRSEVELNARSHAVTMRAMARLTGVYPAAKRALFLAEAAAVMSGNPIERYLPAVTDGRENWLSPTQLGALLGRSGITVGRALKELGLHGDNDQDRKFSEAIWNKGQHSGKQLKTYLYDPDNVMPKLREYFGGTSESEGEAA